MTVESSGPRAEGQAYQYPPIWARALVDGSMSPEQVDNAIWTAARLEAAARAWPECTPLWVRKILNHLVKEWLQRISQERRLAAHRIEQGLWPLANRHALAGEMRLEAHRLNQMGGSVFTAREVDNLVADFLNRGLRPRGGPRRGR